MGWLLEVAVGVGLMVMLWVLLTPPMVIRSQPRRPITEAVFHARQIGMALYKFQNEYGEYPSSSTAVHVRLNPTGITLGLKGNTSNDFFAQLLPTYFAQSEQMFYAKSEFSRKPDELWTSDATVLAHGECGFAYIAGVDPEGDPETPIAFGPAIPGTTTLDRKSCEGKAVIVRIDNSTITLPINSAGRIIHNGLDLLDPRQPYWNGKAPDVKWPK
jgi:hypothetical protein